jgi:L-ribulokinase
VYAWFMDVLLWPVRTVVGATDLVNAETRTKIIAEAEAKTIGTLSDAAAAIGLEETGVLALDWMNGRRTPDANQLLKGAITGLNLASDAPRIFRALVEATAFGSRQIVDRFREEGVRIDGVIALGGVAKKSPFIMQTVADVMGMPIAVPRSEQTCALGAAMCAAAAAGIHPSLDAAKKAMGSGVEREYLPDQTRTRIYDRLYERYRRLGAFIEADIMKEHRTA